jgi:hypothetical protein
MNLGVDLITNNVGMSFENVCVLVVALGGMIIYARNAMVGIMLHMLAFALLFVAFYEFGLDYTLPLILTCVMVVVLTLTLYLSSQSSGVAYI